MQKRKSRYLASTKLSDYHIKRIIRFYAEGVQPSEAARQLPISYVTIRNIYHLIRVRMNDLLLYMKMSPYLKVKEYQEQGNWDDSVLFRYIEKELSRRSGITLKTRPFHEAELIYRFDKTAELGDRFAKAHYDEILAFIAMSGPLNRPVTMEKRGVANRFWLRREKARALAADTAFSREIGHPTTKTTL